MSGGLFTVYDGDTVYEKGRGYRLQGVNAPEVANEVTGAPAEGGSESAKNLFYELVSEPGVTMEPTGETTYGRDVTKFIDSQGRDLSVRAVELGGALPVGKFATPEQKAAVVKAGALRTGLFRELNTPMEQNAIDRSIADPRDPLQVDLSRGPGVIDNRGVLSKSLARGLDQAQGNLYGAVEAVGSMVDSKTLRDYGLLNRQWNEYEAARSPREVESFEKARGVGEVLTHAGEIVAEQIPMMSTMAVGGGAGAAMKGIGSLLRLGRAVSYKGAGIAGATLANYGLGVGEIQSELADAGIDSGATALIAGVPFAAADMFGIGFALKGVMKDIPLSLSMGMFKQVIGAAAKHGALSAGVEAGTETLQELISMTAHKFHDPSFEITSDDSLSRLKEAALAGAVAGGVMGGGGKLVSGGVKAAIAKLSASPAVTSPGEPSTAGPTPLPPPPPPPSAATALPPPSPPPPSAATALPPPSPIEGEYIPAGSDRSVPSIAPGSPAPGLSRPPPPWYATPALPPPSPPALTPPGAGPTPPAAGPTPPPELVPLEPVPPGEPAPFNRVPPGEPAPFNRVPPGEPAPFNRVPPDEPAPPVAAPTPTPVAPTLAPAAPDPRAEPVSQAPTFAAPAPRIQFDLDKLPAKATVKVAGPNGTYKQVNARRAVSHVNKKLEAVEEAIRKCLGQ